MPISVNRSDLKVSTRLIYDELKRQGARVEIIDASSSLISYQDLKGNDHLMFSTSSDKSAASGFAITANKHRTSIIANMLNIPIPEEIICDNPKSAEDFLSQHTALVVKPHNSSGGNGVTVNIRDMVALKKAYTFAKRYSSKVLVQQHIVGVDIRLLIVNGIFCSAVERRPAHVIGDGHSTIKQLISYENKSPLRVIRSMAVMDLIDLKSAKHYLGDAMYDIPKKGLAVRVIGPANLSRGGTAHEATHLVTREMIADSEKITKKLKIDICGVDMMWDKVTNKYYLIEVNNTPGINMHNEPFWGTSSDALQKYVTWLVH